MKVKNVLLIMLLVVISGCAVTMYTYRTNYPVSVSTEDIVAAAISALQDTGFTIAVANERIGIVSTDWKALTSAGSVVFQKILSGSATTRRMKMTISVTKQSNLIKLNPIVQEKDSWGGHANKNISEKEKKLAEKVINRMCEMLEISTDSIEIVTYKD